MERKIGEIFEYDDEWYQCVKTDTYCKGCVFEWNKGLCNDIIGNCDGFIFKKLEKVGEPFSNEHFGLVQKYELKRYGYSTKDKRVCFVDGYDVFIKIKQNKEDMEEKKQCGDNRFEVIEKAKRHLLHSTNIESNKEEMKLLDVFLLRCWQMGWLDSYDDAKHYNSEKDWKEFNLEAAKAGKPVCTRDGRKARIICFDRNDLYPIVALIECEDGTEMIGAYSKEGQTEIYEIKGTDLMMLPEKKEGWVNVYPDDSMGEKRYSTKEEALCYSRSNVIDTVKVEWEE